MQLQRALLTLHIYINSLPEAVVCADTVDTFKNRLDKFWQDQEVLYNFKADICTGSRSQVSAILN